MAPWGTPALIGAKSEVQDPRRILKYLSVKYDLIRRKSYDLIRRKSGEGRKLRSLNRMPSCQTRSNAWDMSRAAYTLEHVQTEHVCSCCASYVLSMDVFCENNLYVK